MITQYTTEADLQEMIEKGNYLQAIDTAQKELYTNDNGEVRKSLALAFTRTGSLGKAMEVLAPLLKEDQAEPDIRALMGGILKRRWEITGESSSLEQSFENYLKAFREGGGYWAGINAATLASVMDMDMAEVLADEVLGVCWEEYGRMGTRSSFWLLVSIAEGHLVKGDLSTALKWYKLVTSMAYRSAGKLRTVRRNARILGNKIGDEALKQLREAIHTPRIAFFAGHRIDREGMAARFPQEDADAVKKKLRTALGKYRISVGVASLADGADILFHECLIEAGRQSRVVLPAPVKSFREKLAVDDPGGWLQRFDNVIEKASVVETVSMSTFENYCDDVYDLATDFMIGYSLNLTEELDGEMVSLVVWNKQIQERRGGTFSAVKKLRKLGMEPEVIQMVPGEENSREVNCKPRQEDSCEGAPFRSAIVVIGAGSVNSNQEKARRLEELAVTVNEAVKRSKCTVIRKSLGYEEIYLIFRGVPDAESFIHELVSADSHCTVTAHVDFSIRFEKESFATREIFSPALSDVVSVNRMLTEGDVFCTTGFRSLARFSNLKGFLYQYAGSYGTNNSENVYLFRMTRSDGEKRS